MQLDAVALVDHLSDVILAEHWHAIGEGRRADGSNLQPPLADYGRAGREAAEGVRPDVRGFTGSSQKPFRDNIERTAIKVRGAAVRRSVQASKGAPVVNEAIAGTRASTRIQPDKLHRNFLKFEARRGNKFIHSGGYILRLVDEALGSWLGVAIDGVLEKADKRDRKARRAKTK